MIRSKDISPVNLERGYMVANKIAECHEAAIKLFGEQFHEKTKPIRLALNELIEKSGCGAVGAGIHLLKFLKEKGNLNAMAIMMTCAVVYDIRAIDMLTKEIEPLIEKPNLRSESARQGGGPADSSQ